MDIVQLFKMIDQVFKYCCFIFVIAVFTAIASVNNFTYIAL